MTAASCTKRGKKGSPPIRNQNTPTTSRKTNLPHRSQSQIQDHCLGLPTNVNYTGLHHLSGRSHAMPVGHATSRVMSARHFQPASIRKDYVCMPSSAGGTKHLLSSEWFHHSSIIRWCSWQLQSTIFLLGFADCLTASPSAPSWPP